MSQGSQKSNNSQGRLSDSEYVASVSSLNSKKRFTPKQKKKKMKKAS